MKKVKYYAILHRGYESMESKPSLWDVMPNVKSWGLNPEHSKLVEIEIDFPDFAWPVLESVTDHMRAEVKEIDPE